MMLEIIPARTKADCVEIQKVFNHPDIIAYLGGFCILETLIGKMKQNGCTLWKAVLDGKTVGGYVTAGRTQAHQAKFGEVGVLPAYRRQRIGTCLYAAGLFQSIFEGRRLMEDTIVGDNPFQFEALAALGIKKAGILPKKTASFKDIFLFCFNLTIEGFNHILSRLSAGCEIHIEKSFYTEDLWEKNMDIYRKHNARFVTVISHVRNILETDIRIVIDQGPTKPTVKKNAKRRTSNQDQFL